MRRVEPLSVAGVADRERAARDRAVAGPGPSEQIVHDRDAQLIPEVAGRGLAAERPDDPLGV